MVIRSLMADHFINDGQFKMRSSFVSSKYLHFDIVDVFLLQIRPDRQTLYWSATWPKEVEALARQFLRNPYKVSSPLSFLTIPVIARNRDILLRIS